MSQRFTLPSLQGTFAKGSKPRLQPIFEKEPFSPSRSNPKTTDAQETKNGASIETKCLKMNKTQHTTRSHKTLIIKWLFKPLFTHQGLLYFDSEVAPYSPTFHTAKPLWCI